MTQWHPDSEPRGEEIDQASNEDLVSKLTWWATDADHENDPRRAHHLQKLGAELARRAVAANMMRLIETRMTLDDAMHLMRQMLDSTGAGPDHEETKARVRRFLDDH